MFLHLLEAAFLELEAQDKHETSPSRQELFRIRQFGEAWMLSTGHASKSSDRREYGVVRQTRTAKWLSAIGTFAGDCGLCYMVSFTLYQTNVIAISDLGYTAV
jgi:hypothetical protein